MENLYTNTFGDPIKNGNSTRAAEFKFEEYHGDLLFYSESHKVYYYITTFSKWNQYPFFFFFQNLWCTNLINALLLALANDILLALTSFFNLPWALFEMLWVFLKGMLYPLIKIFFIILSGLFFAREKDMERYKNEFASGKGQGYQRPNQAWNKYTETSTTKKALSFWY